MTKASTWAWVFAALLALLLIIGLVQELKGYLFWLLVAASGFGVWKITKQRRLGR